MGACSHLYCEREFQGLKAHERPAGGTSPAGFFIMTTEAPAPVPIPKTVKGPYFVVEMTNRWKQRKIERGAKPTHVHKGLKGAIEHAQARSAKNPDRHFAVFECIGYYVSRPTG